ncbi:MAG: metalloregulator ArsR/SmtB family transcription factor [Dehalococcoidia bacterium]
METDDLTPVWKALADPIRRRLLDLLRDGPKTTGDLCDRFECTRFAIMKHLDVLEAAGLVLVRRRGRERWNYLNAVPVQRIYERWISPYEAHWASSLLRLKRGVEKMEEPMPSQTLAALRVADIAFETQIDAPPERVFAALTEEIAAWWGAPYLSSEMSTNLVLEPRVGGRFYETTNGDDGVLWATVSRVQRPATLVLDGTFGMTGAIHGTVSYVLEAHDGGTLVKLSHRAIGELSQETEQGYGSGWQDLLGTRLKAFVETGVRYGLGHPPPAATA